jgi:proton glutamate symport protein
VILSGTPATFGLPLEGVAIILGVDAIMDMARTSTNLIGNCLATVVMARWEGEFSEPPARSAPRTGRTSSDRICAPGTADSGAAPAASERRASIRLAHR